MQYSFKYIFQYENMEKKNAFLASAILVISAVLLSGCISSQGTVNNTGDILVGNDSDEHGCRGSAGYSWCEAKQKCIRVWEENCTANLSCACPEGYVREGDACNPSCYYSTPKCLMPSIQCSRQENTGIANPASVFCEDNGGTLEVVTEDSGQIGICTLSNGTKCEEWAYFRGECGQQK
jgi:hypothetical protein